MAAPWGEAATARDGEKQGGGDRPERGAAPVGKVLTLGTGAVAIGVLVGASPMVERNCCRERRQVNRRDKCHG